MTNHRVIIGDSGKVRHEAHRIIDVPRPLILWASMLAWAVACDEAGPGGPSLPVNEVVYRTAGTDGARGAAALPDGGFVVAGLTEGKAAPTDGTIGFPLVLRVRADGRVESNSVYRGIGYGEAMAVVPFSSGLAVLASHGIDEGSSVGRPDVSLYRTRLDGDRQEVLFHLPETSLLGQSLLRTHDDGFVLVLFRANVDSNDLVKLDGTGAVLWTYRMPKVQDVVSAAESPNGDLFVLGGLSSRRKQLARLGLDGHEIWRRTYGDDTLWRTTVVVAIGEGAAVLGSRSEEEPGVESVVVTRFNSVGEVEWERKYATGRVYADAAAALEDGGLVFGYTEEYGESGVGNSRAYVVRISTDGEELWRRAFGPYRGTTSVHAIVPLTDGRIVAAGRTGKEGVRGLGGEDFDMLAVFYQPE